MNMDHMNYLSRVCEEDVEVLMHKEATYQGSWKKRGGTGAFMMLARKWDRIEGILENYDIFAAIEADMSGDDGTMLAEVRDLRRYLLLVEAEMLSRLGMPSGSGVSQDDPTGQEHPFGYVSEDDLDAAVESESKESVDSLTMPPVTGVPYQRHPINATSAEYELFRDKFIGHGKMVGKTWSVLYQRHGDGRWHMLQHSQDEYGK